MAIYHLHLRRGRRGSPAGALRSAAAKASYVLRRGRYARGSAEVEHALSGHMPAWAAGDPALYWETADAHERANASLFVELEFSLPRELGPAAGRELALGFARSLCDGERLPYTLAVHRGGGSNPHCHLMISERVNDGIDRPAELWFRRAGRRDPAAGGAAKSRSLQPKQWLREARASWAAHANQALELAGHGCRIDHRTLEAQREEALAAGDLRLAESLDRLPVHQSRASLALEDEDPDGRPGTAPRPARARKRRRRRRKPGTTPTSETALGNRGANARLAGLKQEIRHLEAEMAGPAEEKRERKTQAAEAAPRATPAATAGEAKTEMPAAELAAARVTGDYRGPERPESLSSLTVCGDRTDLRRLAIDERADAAITTAGAERWQRLFSWLRRAARRVMLPFRLNRRGAAALTEWAAGQGIALTSPEPRDGWSPPELRPPPDREIEAARKRLETRNAELRRRAEAKQAAEDAIAAADEKRMKAEAELASARFFETRRKKDLRKAAADAERARRAAQETLERLAALEPAPAADPDDLRLAGFWTSDERKQRRKEKQAEAAANTLAQMTGQQRFFPRARDPQFGQPREYPPGHSLLFVVARREHVPAEGSYARKWHHVAVWDPATGPEELRALRLAHPGINTVAAAEVRAEVQAADADALSGEAADHQLHNAGLQRHIDAAEGRLDTQQPEPEAEKKPSRDHDFGPGM